MKIKDYYIKELNSLRVEGAEFARKNPGLSSYLSKEGQDPDVERMLEGFSFLTGKLHQRLDEDLPEVSHNLVQLLWPNYIRPVPSSTIIQFDAIKNDLKNVIVDKGTQLLSKNAADGVVCKFNTCYETKVMPLELQSIEYFTVGQKSLLEMDFSVSASGTLVDINFEPLRLFLGGSKFMSKELYLYLDRYVEKIEVVIKGKDQNILESLILPKASIKSVGFDRREVMVPHPHNVFNGYVILQEYFSYQDKHLFIDILNLEKISSLAGDILVKSRNFSIKLHFTKHFSATQLPELEDFKLYCTPAINLFESDAVPIRKTEIEDEYIVVPSDLKKEQSEVFSIEAVRGWVPSKNSYQDYVPFESFKHVDNNGEYYSQRVKLNDNDHRMETFLRFASAGGYFDDLEHNKATISVKILCTNKNVPSTLHLGDICVNNPISSLDLKFKNITIATESYPPPIGGDFLWRVISNMSLNYLSLDNIQTLKMILQTYDFLGESNLKEKEKTDTILSGLTSITNNRTQMIYEGLPIQGIETELYIDPFRFTCVGEAYLLCCVLNEFFALYCNLNTFHRLVVHMKDIETFTFAPKMGQKVLT